MKSYRTNPITELELDKWDKKQTHNPRTNRKIKPTSRILRYIKREKLKREYGNESYNDFHCKKIDPILKINLPIIKNKPLFKFEWQWDPFTGERTKIDPRGPLFFDPDTLIHYFYLNRLKHLWIHQANGYQANYGDGMGKGIKFEIIGRGCHPEWYLFRLPLPDAYLNINTFNQYVTFGPVLNYNEIEEIYNLGKKYGNNYQKRFGKPRPNLILLSNYYHNAIKKLDIKNISQELINFLGVEGIKHQYEELNRSNVDKLKKL